MARHEVVITGIGLVTPVGNSSEKNWNALVSGTSGISRFEMPHDDDHLSTVAGLVKNDQRLIDAILDRKNQRKIDRFTRLALIASKEALHDAGFDTNEAKDRFGVYLGVGVGGLDTMAHASVRFERDGVRALSPFMLPRVISNEAASWITLCWNLLGPVLVVTNACSSGTDAIGLAYRSIRDGYNDRMLAGGTESCVNPLVITAFSNMRALSTWKGDPTQASRPFDKQRTGFVIAEGAGVVILERKDLALARGAKIYAEVVGYGATADAHHITAMDPEGKGAQRAIELAIKEAGVVPHNIGYVNAHGTGTPMNDRIETHVIKQIFGGYADRTKNHHLCMSSTKSMTGHMLGAAGGAEVSFTALSLFKQTMVPTINRDTYDEQCDLDYVTSGACRSSFDYALSNSFGFGGCNASILLKRYT